MLWPSASFISLPSFLVSNIVTAIGISSLELAANSFITLCGPPQYGDMRLLFAQAMQAVGAAVSELIADEAFAPLIQKKRNLIHVQWTYFSVALFTIVIALCFHYMPLPEASDDDLQEELQPDLLPMNRMARKTSLTHIGGIRVVFLILALGVMVQSIYILSQEAFNIWYIYVLAEGLRHPVVLAPWHLTSPLFNRSLRADTCWFPQAESDDELFVNCMGFIFPESPCATQNSPVSNVPINARQQAHLNALY
ncbi:hypothetical protein V502_01020 [Pseudogymnoascus sp. VKM F-4520 (FW-2644)]|nr:hypothetical protein V502_01020 [Pseudogymnoascus sp. VKM F-4520 (FW-2644)]